MLAHHMGETALVALLTAGAGSVVTMRVALRGRRSQVSG
jgi:hypothetical protein